MAGSVLNGVLESSSQNIGRTRGTSVGNGAKNGGVRKCGWISSWGALVWWWSWERERRCGGSCTSPVERICE